MPTGIYKRTTFHKKRISESMRGIIPKNFYNMREKGWNTPKRKGTDNPFWKGDNASYFTIHKWLYKTFGRPSKCERCGTLQSKRYEWANKSRLYKRDISDWEQLCSSCHIKDHIQKGEHPRTNKGSFTKGHIPWNKLYIYR